MADDTRNDDEGVRAFIERQPRHLKYSEVAEACLREFGAERAWSCAEVAAYWHRVHRPKPGRASRVDQDPEVRDFLADRLGRVTLDQALEQSRQAFGRDRTPSRSAIHAFWSRLRSRHGGRQPGKSPQEAPGRP